MPDRFQLPDYRQQPCRSCGKDRPEYPVQCADCDKSICSSCSVMALPGNWPDVELCQRCALKRLNQQLVALVPACECSEWPAWVRYGHQLSLREVA